MTLEKIIAESLELSDRPEALTSLAVHLTPLIASGQISDLIDVRSAARRSYFHTNGFVKIVLFRDPATAISVRLHVWPADAFDDGNVHSHKWTLRSAVLAGVLQEDRYVLSVGDEWDIYDYRRGGVSRSAAEANGACRLAFRCSSGATVASRLVREQGSYYEMPPETLHRSRTVGSAALTLVITENTDRQTSEVVVATGSTPIDVPPVRLPPDGLIEALASAAEILRPR